MPADPPMSVANKPLPLTADFPFAAWRTPPPDLDIPDDMDIAERNEYNDRVDKFNLKSIQVTRAYEAVLQAGGTPAITSDIGPPLRAPYAYTNDEMDLMVDSESFCLAAAPIPASLMRIIIVMRVDRLKEVEKKKEREKSAKESGLDLVGKLVMRNPHRAEPLTRPDAVLPTVFLHALSSRLHPPLFWFTDARLRFVDEHPSEIFTKKIGAVATDANKIFMDVPKVKALWGSDDSSFARRTTNSRTTINSSSTAIS
ncbi:hypothetical protein C8R47DRAFT_1296111 [Mycena vitilis]|nr:hypothetical protein C8R47DRAFT_1296111 [Mycena vitilis]